MNGHILSAASAYIEDYMFWYLTNKNTQDLANYINDRFAMCSDNQKEELFKVFKNLDYSNTSETVTHLYKILFDS